MGKLLREDAGGDGGELVVLVNDADGGLRVIFEEGFGVFGEAGGRREGIGELGLWEDDGGGAAGRETEASAVVDEVGVGFPFCGETLEEVAGGGDGAVFKRDTASGSEAEGAEADVPTFFFRGGGSNTEVSGGGDEGLGIALFFEVVKDEVSGEAFGDTAEIELHVFLGHGNGLLGFVEDQEIDAATEASCRDFLVRGNSAGTIRFSPEVGEGAVGGIEDAVAFFGEFLAKKEHLEEVFTDGDGSAEGGFGETIELGRGIVIGGALAKFFGEIKGFFDGAIALFGVRGVGDDFEESPHERALRLNAD